jgi:hypothetical protein
VELLLLICWTQKVTEARKAKLAAAAAPVAAAVQLLTG